MAVVFKVLFVLVAVGRAVVNAGGGGGGGGVSGSRSLSPFYVDPLFSGAHDPELVFHREEVRDVIPPRPL